MYHNLRIKRTSNSRKDPSLARCCMLRSRCPLMCSILTQKHWRQQTFFHDTLFQARQLAAIRSFFPMPSYRPDCAWTLILIWNSLVCLLVAYGRVLHFGCRLPRMCLRHKLPPGLSERRHHHVRWPEKLWDQWVDGMGLSENRLNPYTQWFCWSLSLWKMAIINWEY